MDNGVTATGKGRRASGSGRRETGKWQRAVGNGQGAAGKGQLVAGYPPLIPVGAWEVQEDCKGPGSFSRVTATRVRGWYGKHYAHKLL